jgi:hypothetical protein
VREKLGKSGAAGATVFFALQHPADWGQYSSVVEMLVAAGADVGAVVPFPTGNEPGDALLQRHGAGRDQPG